MSCSWFAKTIIRSQVSKCLSIHLFFFPFYHYKYFAPNQSKGKTVKSVSSCIKRTLFFHYLNLSLTTWQGSCVIFDNDISIFSLLVWICHIRIFELLLHVTNGFSYDFSDKNSKVQHFPQAEHKILSLSVGISLCLSLVPVYSMQFSECDAGQLKSSSNLLDGRISG